MKIVLGVAAGIDKALGGNADCMGAMSDAGWTWLVDWLFRLILVSQEPLFGRVAKVL
jgi:hypothetical protein